MTAGDQVVLASPGNSGTIVEGLRSVTSTSSYWISGIYRYKDGLPVSTPDTFYRGNPYVRARKLRGKCDDKPSAPLNQLYSSHGSTVKPAQARGDVVKIWLMHSSDFGEWTFCIGTNFLKFLQKMTSVGKLESP